MGVWVTVHNDTTTHDPLQYLVSLILLPLPNHEGIKTCDLRMAGQILMELSMDITSFQTLTFEF
jgi:hypothetical protein